MADQPINGLPKKATAADTDALLMIGASEEYQIDYGKLADAILNKLTNKTFTLDQGSKSLVAALNELNSKTTHVNGFFKFSNDNFVGFNSEFKKIPSGIYYCNKNNRGNIAENPDFTSNTNCDPDWYDYRKISDGILFIFGSKTYASFIAIGCIGGIAVRQLKINSGEWETPWKYNE